MTSKPPPSTLAFLAAALFYLAGGIEIAAAFIGKPPHTVSIGIGVMFFGVGSVWLAIAAHYKKKSPN